MAGIDGLKEVLWIALAAAAIALAGCRQSAESVPPKPEGGGKEVSKPVPPVVAQLLLDGSGGDAPLEDGPEGIKQPPRHPKGKEADNSRCHVCHTNFSEERLAVAHAWADVGCEKCHGPSDAHCSDEGNVTPPTTMYGKGDVDKSCKVCHPDDRIVEGAKSCPVVVLDTDKAKYCTDCHGRHQMARRTVRWDTVTRKLLPKEALTK
jgi:hypothetical protein